MKTIVAVAIGAIGTHVITKKEDLNDAPARKVRRYLHGLVRGLNRRGYKFGADPTNNKHFRIVFRLTNVAGLANAATFKDETGMTNGDVIFCMSTRVTKEAGARNLGVPIVGIVSEPPATFQVDPFCGVSAKRVQKAGDCFDNFRLAVPTLTKIFVLGNSNYNVSNRAKAKVTAAAQNAGNFAVPDIDVTAIADLEDMLAAALTARTKNAPCTEGLLVLPVDMFLSRARKIIDLVQSELLVPTFFPVPDWVTGKPSSALGAYGVPQRRCGVLMAEQVHSILANNQIPQGANRWIETPDYDLEFSTSAAAAAELGITLGPDIPPPEE